jgi:hypothetical protein
MKCGPRPGRVVLARSGRLDDTVLQDEPDRPQGRDAPHGIAVDRDQIGAGAGPDPPQIVAAEDLGCRSGRGAQRLERRQPVLDQQLQLPRVLAVRKDPDVAAVGDRHPARSRGREGLALRDHRRIVAGEVAQALQRFVRRQRRDVRDAVLGHEREHLGGPLVAVLDRADAGQRSPAHPLGGRRVRGDRNPRVARNADDERQLVGAEGRARVAGRTEAVVGVHLDPVGAARDLAARGAQDRLRSVDLFGALRDAAPRMEAGRTVRAARDDRARDADDPGPRHDAFLDRAAQAGVGLAGTLGAEIANGREPGGEGPLRGDHRARDAERFRVSQHLIGPRALVVRVQQQVRVQVDQSRQQRRVRKIDRASPLRGAKVRPGGGDVLPLEQDLPALAALLAVEDGGRADQDGAHGGGVPRPGAKNLKVELLTTVRPWFERDDWEAEATRRGLGPREAGLVDTFRREGFVVVEDGRILDELDVDGIWARLAPHFAADGAGRVQDAWTEDAAVRAIATHPAVIAVLRMLYGREPVPFQTLNFLNGTEQRTHSDTIHFSSLPTGFMCGVWMALEDVALRQGPLHYFPGSQWLPEFDYEDFGVPAVVGEPSWRNPNTLASYRLYEDRIDAIARESGFRREELAIRRGSFLIWSANLLHGGSPRDDRTLTRKSQVTHYYFDGAVPFTPMHSRRSEGAFAVRRVHDIGTGELIVPTLDGAPVVFPVRDEWTRGIRRVDGFAGKLATRAMTAYPLLPRSSGDATRLAVRATVKKLLRR